LVLAKANWRAGLALGAIGFAGEEYFGNFAKKYDDLEALIKRIHTRGVYIQTVDTTVLGVRSTSSIKTVSVFTYEGHIIGELGY
jgi:hypothetical protein